MSQHLTPTARRARTTRKVAGRTIVGVLLTVIGVATLVPSAWAITKPASISNTDWNAQWNPSGVWPPTANADWPVPTANNTVNQKCGIDLGVIIDRSGSIVSAGQGTAYKTAVKSLVDVFAGTPSKIGFWSFGDHASNTSTSSYPWHQVVALDGPSGATNVAELKTGIDSIPLSSTTEATNFEEGLLAPLTAPVAADPANTPDLYLVLTDGEPTVHADDSSSLQTNNDDVAGGIASADALKATGKKVFVVGVGSGVSEAGLKLISGPTAFDGVNFPAANYLTTSFDDLKLALTDFALSLCGASVTVTKEVSTMAAPTTYAPAAGWQIDGTISGSPTNTIVTPADKLTDDNGHVRYAWQSFTDQDVTVTEVQKPGYKLVSATCTVDGESVEATPVDNGVKLTLGIDEHAQCTFQNQPVFIDLSISKSDGKTSTAPGAVNDYTIGFGNAADATATATGVVLHETVPANAVYVAAGSGAWTCADGAVAGTVCTLAVGDIAPGDGGSAHFVTKVISPVGATVSSVTNTATVTGTGTERDQPDQSATDVDTLAGNPALHVVKTDNVASVLPGGTIGYTIAYTNDGDTEATGVVLEETVPAHTTFSATGSDPAWDCSGTAAGSTCTLEVGAVAGGGAGDSVAFAVKVDNPLATDVTNVHNIAVVDDDRCEVSCASDDEDTPVKQPEVGAIEEPNDPSTPTTLGDDVAGETVEELPRTGSDTGMWINVAGLTFLAGGVALMASGTRRRRYS